jgi:hypothetical protein
MQQDANGFGTPPTARASGKEEGAGKRESRQQKRKAAKEASKKNKKKDQDFGDLFSNNLRGAFS